MLLLHADFQGLNPPSNETLLELLYLLYFVHKTKYSMDSYIGVPRVVNLFFKIENKQQQLYLVYMTQKKSTAGIMQISIRKICIK